MEKLRIKNKRKEIINRKIINKKIKDKNYI